MIRNFSALFVLVLSLFLPTLAASAPLGDCTSETGLTGRTDVVFCEPWEKADWWKNGYVGDGSKYHQVPAVAADVSNASIVTDGCISGSCLKVDMKQYQSGALAIHWPLSAAGIQPEELHLRYYLKLGDNFNPNLCAPGGAYTDNGGKFPGLADVRTDVDPSGQCGNGGAYSDGLACWSGRLKFRNCQGSGNADNCAADIDGKQATTRLGWYWYAPPASGNNNQAFGAFDNQSWGTDGKCSDTAGFGSDGTDAGSCGKGPAGLVNGSWYLVEVYAKMNTVGKADGISRAWVNGVLKYEKTNMQYRLAGHDNLHVRTVWLNVHAGGEFMGLCSASNVMLDQLVVTTGARAGAFAGKGSDVTPPAIPSGVRIK